MNEQTSIDKLAEKLGVEVSELLTLYANSTHVGYRLLEISFRLWSLQVLLGVLLLVKLLIEWISFGTDLLFLIVAFIFEQVMKRIR